MFIKIITDIQRGLMYWGNGPLPNGITMLGVVHIDDMPYVDCGALLQSNQDLRIMYKIQDGMSKLPIRGNIRAGEWWIGNAGCMRSLPQIETAKAFKEATISEID